MSTAALFEAIPAATLLVMLKLLSLDDPASLLLLDACGE
jgi:hypothetical protein